MMASLQIRPMNAADIDAVLALAATLSHAPHWPRWVYEAAFRPDRIPRRLCLVAGLPEYPVAGFAITSVLAPEAELESIGVSAEFQRRGIARALFSATLGSLGARHIRTLHLEVRASNAPALALYGALGFIQTGCRPAYYSHPVEDALLLSREL